MRGIILLEGPDGTGKTTLANSLIEKVGKDNAVYIHATYRFKDRMWEYHEAILRKAIKLSRTKLVIIDRLWLSEMIYAKVYRGGSKWPLMGRFFNRILSTHCAVTIWCIPDSLQEGIDWFMAAKEERPEMYEDIREVILGYILEYENNFGNDINHVRYNKIKNDTETLIDNVESLLAYLRRGQFYEALEPDIYNYAGYLASARYLIIGERSNPKGRHKVWPFFEHKNSSLFLTQTLEDIGVREKEIVWVNYYCDDEPNYITKLIDARPDLKIIVLNSKVSSILKRVGIKHEYVPHPAFAKRFNIKEYDKELLKAFKEEE